MDEVSERVNQEPSVENKGPDYASSCVMPALAFRIDYGLLLWTDSFFFPNSKEAAGELVGKYISYLAIELLEKGKALGEKRKGKNVFDKIGLSETCDTKTVLFAEQLQVLA